MRFKRQQEIELREHTEKLKIPKEMAILTEINWKKLLIKGR